MHTVKRAIIMAAGKGERMRPLTLNTPKPLIRVNGKRMIDSVIHALHQNDIIEIYIVVGYKKDLFACLEAEYPGLKLIENPDYDCCNNISSLYYAREHLSDCMILDGDQLIRNPAILNPEFEKSGYNAVWTDQETDEWLLTVKDGMITRCSRTGGKGGWQLYSISRWSAEDGAKLRRHLELEYAEKKNTGVYWDDVPLFCHPEEYELGVREMNRDDVVEIDTLEELAAEDPNYLLLLEKQS
ncbi:MAG: NTP transferase domain-containing protein [Oscillospiraceae bacterium]|nr:NTP transferase domain-containing protein [Oscillospiraceae bacterium]